MYALQSSLSIIKVTYNDNITATEFHQVMQCIAVIIDQLEDLCLTPKPAAVDSVQVQKTRNPENWIQAY